MVSDQWLVSSKKNMTVKSYQELSVWKKSIDLTKEVYAATKNFPKEEIFGLTSQLRRACVSIPSNIAEGQSRGTQDFKRFLTIAMGSLAEVETQLLISKELGYLQIELYSRIIELCSEIGKMLNGLHRSLGQ